MAEAGGERLHEHEDEKEMAEILELHAILTYPSSRDRQYPSTVFYPDCLRTAVSWPGIASQPKPLHAFTRPILSSSEVGVQVCCVVVYILRSFGEGPPKA